jgi:hypothetical protein
MIDFSLWAQEIGACRILLDHYGQGNQIIMRVDNLGDDTMRYILSASKHPTYKRTDVVGIKKVLKGFNFDYLVFHMKDFIGEGETNYMVIRVRNREDARNLLIGLGVPPY